MEFISIMTLATIAIMSPLLVHLAVSFWPEKNKRYPPVAGTILRQLVNFRRVHHYMTELACKYKTYKILGLFRTVVYTADPANVEYVLKTNFSNYNKGMYMRDILSDYVGDGIFAVDGEKWLHQRKASSSQFSTKVLRDFSSEIFKSNALKLAGIIHKAAKRSISIDIQELFMKSTLDSIVTILLGFDLDTLSATNNKEYIKFSKASDESTGAIYRGFDIFWKIKRFLNIGSEAMIKENINVVDKFVYNLINTKIELLKTSEHNESQLKKRDFISRLIETRETDPKYLRDMVFSFITAGKDTTTSALSWFIYMMCKHLDIQDKIAEEIRQATSLNSSSSGDEFSSNVTKDSLRKMQYLHATLSETLRIYPAVPMLARCCCSDDTWPDGHSVRKGELAVIQPYAMGRMKRIWGDDAEEFTPERWLDENGNFKDESPFKFTAFSGGQRICLGRDYSYMQMKIFSAVLLSRYRFKLADETKMANYKTLFTLEIDGGLHVHAFPRG